MHLQRSAHILPIFRLLPLVGPQAIQGMVTCYIMGHWVLRIYIAREMTYPYHITTQLWSNYAETVGCPQTCRLGRRRPVGNW